MASESTIYDISILIPAKNGLPYLRYAIISALDSGPSNLAIEILVSIDEPRGIGEQSLIEEFGLEVKFVIPPKGLTMSEHWDYLQKEATGRWQMFLGQDDLLMRGFAKRAEKLISRAEVCGLELIVGRRAYITWPGLEGQNNDLAALQYWRTGLTTTRRSRVSIFKSLVRKISYHAGPQMYTSTLVRNDLLKEVRKRQLGKLILGHPQDAFLAASLLLNSERFLFTGQPFSWVGTSPKSAGLAISSGGTSLDESQLELARTYFESVSKSDLGDSNSNQLFQHGVTGRYFLDALDHVSLRGNPKTHVTVPHPVRFVLNNLYRYRQNPDPTNVAGLATERIDSSSKVPLLESRQPLRQGVLTIKLFIARLLSPIIGFQRQDDFETEDIAFRASRNISA